MRAEATIEEWNKLYEMDAVLEYLFMKDMKHLIAI